MLASGQGRKAASLLAGILLAWPACHAVLFKSTDDPTYNTGAPTGALTNSGWDLQGWWGGSYLGTPIAPRYFVTAKHVGGSIGGYLGLGPIAYHTTAYYDDPNSDLRVWRVAETFPTYALLFTNTNEVGKHCVVFGRGTQRGAPIIVSGVTNGWAWGASDTWQRWGENDISSIYVGGAGTGDLLRATLDRSGGSNECQLSVGDSSGAVFVQDASNVWRLAGINHAVDDPFISTNGVGAGFNAAMLDYGGVYTNRGGFWQLCTNQSTDIPSAFYSTRISSHITWIKSVIDYLPGDDLRITAITATGTNVVISFNTILNQSKYVIDRRDSITGGSWTNLTNGIVGAGGVMTYTDVGAATLSNRFYRLGLVP